MKKKGSNAKENTPPPKGKGGKSEPTHQALKEEIEAFLKPSEHDQDSEFKSIRTQIKNIYKRIDTTSSRYRFKKTPSAAEVESKPMVVFLGNHSSGKSTFINYILKTEGSVEDLQKTGVAPLDDGFTFITYGEQYDEQGGPAIVANTNLPFTSLSKFGEQFVTHLRVKMCPLGPSLREVVLVDSPGMIDSATEGADRGYDFIKTVRWFAERADYVLVFFDPDKPGTTGESLEVFTKALTGIDHKLLILMNKVDKFQNISDFSRALGALCWNLAKVIPYKDIPYIYMTFVPVEGQQPSKSWSVDEFQRSREEIIDKIRHAPSRHMDNMLTELKKYCEQLLLHSKVIDAARKKLWWYRLTQWSILVLFVASLCAITWRFTEGDPFMTAIPLIVLILGFLVINKLVASKERELIVSFSDIFQRVHASEILSKDLKEDLERMWDALLPSIKATVERFGLLSFPQLKNREVAALETVIQESVPNLLQAVHRTLKGNHTAKKK